MSGTKSSVLTGADCAETARKLKDGLQRVAVRVAPHHTLGRMIAQAEMLAAAFGDADVFDGWEAAAPARQDEIRDAAFAMEQAERIAAALEVSDRIRNFGVNKKWLKKRVDRLESQDSRGLDHLFEIEVAGRLARQPGLDVAFEEPDVGFSHGSQRVYLACKRPRSLEGVGNVIRDGRHQAERRAEGRAGPAIIVVGTEAIFHHLPSGTRWFRFPTIQDGEAALAEALEQVSATADPEAVKTLHVDSVVGGILFFGTVTFWADGPAREEAAYYCRRQSAKALHRSDAEAESLVVELTALLKD